MAKQYPKQRTWAWHRPMRPRDTEEPHRVATPLELLFDLSFVVAVAQAAAGLHHDIAENHLGEGVLSFVMVFYAIWWAWMNFTWFASAYDTDDVAYRLTTMVQIGGSLVLAAGVPSAFENDFTVVVAGYVIMRLAMVVQWLRASAGDPESRPATLRYAAGITVAQACWVVWVLNPGWPLALFVVFALLDLAVPVWAERKHGTNYHRHHVAERYGLFTIIVLGETILGATNAVREGLAEAEHIGPLISLSAAGLVLVFSLWWLYFDQPAHERLSTLRGSLTWGYGHYLIFGSAAALGAGIEVAVDFDAHKAHVGGLAVGLATTIPVALFLLSVWALHIGPRNQCRPIAYGFPLTAVLVLAASFTAAPIHFAAGLCAVLVSVVVVSTRGHAVDD